VERDYGEVLILNDTVLFESFWWRGSIERT
jgi:hypothetical protein